MKKYGKIIIIVVGILAVLALLILIYFKVTFISKDRVKEIIVDNMKVNSSDVYFDNIDFELDKSIYEVDIYYQNREYEYKIDAKEGKIIYTDYIYNNQNTVTNNSNSSNNNNNNNNNNNSNNSQSSNTTSNISLDEAKNIALTHANIALDNVNFLRTETEYEHNTLVYEIDFTYNNYEYDYKIDANTGEIISYDKDSIYD